MKIWFHADDFGITREQSEMILACHKQGVLNSISIIPNTGHMDEVSSLLETEDDTNEIRRILHLNFVEGMSLTPKEEVPDLVDEKGMFCCSFMKLFIKDMLLHGTKRNYVREQLKKEILAQIDAVNTNIHEMTGIDAHQHYHMIPIVFEALCQAMDERPDLKLSYIRISIDPASPLLTTPKVWKNFRAINFVKWCILKFHAGKIKKELDKRNISYPTFFGIFFTCEMKEDIVKTLLPKYEKIARQKNKDLELMFHPGALFTREELLDPKSEELYQFYLSENRELEKKCLLSIML